MIPAVTSIRRKMRQRFGISAPKVGVRSEVHWFWRALLWVAVISLALGASRWIYDAGMRYAGFDRDATTREIAELQATRDRLTEQLAQAAEAARGHESRLQVELTTIEQLGQKLRALQDENAGLKEELALFEGMMSGSGTAQDGIRIARARIEPAKVAGRFRFSVLIVRQLGKAKNAKDANGELQFALKVRRAGTDGMIEIPGEGNPATSYFRFVVKHLHRAEGEFSLPAGAELIGGEVRLLQDGSVKLRQPITR